MIIEYLGIASLTLLQLALESNSFVQFISDQLVQHEKQHILACLAS